MTLVIWFPIVYEELRKAGQSESCNQEKPGQTLQATALVHEAFLRLVDKENQQQWENSRHFFAAAAEAMRRILIEKARQKQSLKRGGDQERVELSPEIEPSFLPLACDDILGIRRGHCEAWQNPIPVKPNWLNSASSQD